MFAWVLRIVVLFAILSVVYIALSAYIRWDRRKTLEAEFDAAGEGEEERESFVAQGMSDYDRSLRKKLLLGIYGIPLVIVSLLIALAEWN